jgi:ribulose 1,5-bisphosphate synthetase/thiazole synthase
MSDSISQPLDTPKYDITFPPFPPTPAGVTLVPFKDWEERGICMDPGPLDAEVDTLGIPTILVRSKGHADDVCKTNTKRKRMEQETKARKKHGMSATKSWWEEWEDRESGRAATGVNP